jgi:hypothetical protein
MHSQIDLMKFLEVHKRGIDFYNSYGLGDNKKESNGLIRKMSRSQNRESEQPAPEEKTFKGTFKYYVEKPSIKV